MGAEAEGEKLGFKDYSGILGDVGETVVGEGIIRGYVVARRRGDGCGRYFLGIGVVVEAMDPGADVRDDFRAREVKPDSYRVVPSDTIHGRRSKCDLVEGLPGVIGGTVL